ncbi:MAG TPA: PIN domain-containing protein [Bacteroidales bacterium]
MKIVVDSNIVFSAILNTKSKVGQLIINGSKYFDFYTIGLLKEEIFRHRDKILHFTKFSPKQFDQTYHIITTRIIFADDILLTDSDIKKAIDLVLGIDPNDAPFVALNNHLLAHLWTGDKHLINGLKKKKYSRVLTTDELYEIFLNKQLKVKGQKKDK